jgi:hypothetical protein
MGRTGDENEDREPGNRGGADSEARTLDAAAGFFDPGRLCHTVQLTGRA